MAVAVSFPFKMPTPSIFQLKRALSIQEQIERLQAELQTLLGTGATPWPKPTASAEKPAKKKSGMSAAGRARIAAAQKARWAKVKGTTEAPKTVAEPKAKKKSRKMSPEARARIVAAQKKRWAAFKKGK